MLFTTCTSWSWWDGGSLQWALPAVSLPEVTLSETGSSAAATHNSPAETARSAYEKTLMLWNSFSVVMLQTLNNYFCAGASIPNGEFSNVMSVPVQFTHEIPAYLLEKPQTLTSVTQIPATHCGADYHSRNTKSFPDLLADDMTKLCVDVPSQRKESVKVENKFPFLLPLDSFACHGASSNESRNSKQNHPAGDRTLHTIRVKDEPRL